MNNVQSVEGVIVAVSIGASLAIPIVIWLMVRQIMKAVTGVVLTTSSCSGEVSPRRQPSLRFGGL